MPKTYRLQSCLEGWNAIATTVTQVCILTRDAPFFPPPEDHIFPGGDAPGTPRGSSRLGVRVQLLEYFKDVLQLHVRCAAHSSSI